MRSELDVRVDLGEVKRVPGLYDILRDDIVEYAIQFAKETKENVSLNIGGISVMVSPGSNVDEVNTNWRQIREMQKVAHPQN